MLSDERLKEIQTLPYPLYFLTTHEAKSIAAELLTLRADRDFWKEQATIEGGRLTDLYTKHHELLPELTEEEKAACDSMSLNIAKMFDEAKAEEAELVSLRAECERLEKENKERDETIDELWESVTKERAEIERLRGVNKTLLEEIEYLQAASDRAGPA